MLISKISPVPRGNIKCIIQSSAEKLAAKDHESQKSITSFVFLAFFCGNQVLELQHQAVQCGYVGLRPGQTELDTGINIQMIIDFVPQTGQGIDRQLI